MCGPSLFFEAMVLGGALTGIALILGVVAVYCLVVRKWL